MYIFDNIKFLWKDAGSNPGLNNHYEQLNLFLGQVFGVWHFWCSAGGIPTTSFYTQKCQKSLDFKIK